MAETETERKIEDLTLRINSIDTKIRINEQNLLNLQSRVQLLSKNLIDLKKEVRDEVDESARKGEKIEKLVNELNKKIKSFRRGSAGLALTSEIKGPGEKQEMTKEDAEKALDNVLKLTEEL